MGGMDLLRFLAIYYLGEGEREKERKNNADHCWPRSISMRTNLWIQVCTVKEFALWCAEMAGRFFTWASNWSLHNVDSLECLKLTVPQELGGNAAAKAYAYHMGSQLLRDIGQSDSKLQIESYRIKLPWPDGQAAVSAVVIVLLFSHIFHNVWYIYIFIYIYVKWNVHYLGTLMWHLWTIEPMLACEHLPLCSRLEHLRREEAVVGIGCPDWCFRHLFPGKHWAVLRFGTGFLQ